MKRFGFATLWALGLLSGCTQYQYAKNVKMVSFEDNVTVGRSVGPVRGQVCQQQVMGYAITDAATLDRAVAAVRAKHQLRYLNNVATEQSGFDTGFYRRTCLSVKGTGYQ